jgi:hypothetical protein
VRRKGKEKMNVSELTEALSKMPQDAKLLGVFVQRLGEMTPERQQEYKVRIVSEHGNQKFTAQFNYSSYVYEKKDPAAPLKQSPFSSFFNKK